MFYYWLSTMLALVTLCVLSGPWLHRFHNAQQRQADALHNIASAMLKRIEWDAACRRQDETDAKIEAARERQRQEAEAHRAMLRAQGRVDVFDDSNLAPEARELLSKLKRPAPPPQTPPEAA